MTLPLLDRASNRRASLRWADAIVGAVAVFFLAVLVGCSATPTGDSPAPTDGTQLRDFTLKTVRGEVTLSKRIQEGPVVLVFYRGHW